jgi:aldehyde dehydrogenase (NAD+)
MRKKVSGVQKLGVFRRAEILLEMSRLIKESRREFAENVRLETGKPLEISFGEVDTAVRFMESLANGCLFNSGSLIPSKSPNKLVMYERYPYGLSALIVSFNTPLPNYAWKFAPAWLAGNSIILKPSEHNPISATLFVKKGIEAGIPSENLGLLFGDKSSGEVLVQQELDLLSFTGSSKTGKSIQDLSKHFVRKTILELGGSNPFIVFPDADLSRVVESIIQSGFSNSGQRCASASRLLLHEDIFDELIEKLQSRMKTLVVGTEEDCEIGPVIDLDAVRRYEDFLRCASSEGRVVQANCLFRGKSEFVVEPALVILNRDSKLFEEELFAPIIKVTSFEQDSEAIELANSSCYGLTAAIWTQSLSRIGRLRNEVKAGVVNVNGPTHGAEFQFPFGGVKQSGNGTKEVGLDSLNEYSFGKLITVDFDNS